MSTGADNKTMPVTVAYEDGYERIYGKREPVRGKWVWDEAQGRLVPAGEYRQPEAKNAPIMAGRFYENTKATDGTDIGSRQRHREYMRQNGLTTADDYKGQWKQQAEQREAARSGHVPSKTRRDAIARKMFQIDKP